MSTERTREAGATFASLLVTCSHQTALLKLADGGKCPFVFFFSPRLLIIERCLGLGEFKKILELDEVKKGAKHVYLDILEMLKWVKKEQYLLRHWKPGGKIKMG